MIRNRELLALQIFNALRFGTAILLSVVFAKVADPNEINVYESLLLVGTTFTFFYASAVNHTLIPSARSAPLSERNNLYRAALCLLVIGAIGSFVALLVYGRIVSEGLEASLLLFYALYILFNVPALLAENILLVENRHRHLVWYGIFSFGLQMAVLSIPLIMGSFATGVILLIPVGLLKFLYTLFLIQKFGPGSLRKETLSALFRVSRPVMGSLFIANGYVYLSAFLVKFRSTEEAFNLFRYGAREFPLFMILANSFSTVQSGYLAGNLSDKPKALAEIRRSVTRLLHQLYPIALLLALSSSLLFRVAFNESLAPAYGIFNILLLLLISRVLFPQSILLALGRTRYLLHASSAEFLIGVGLSYWWLGIYGVEGVAWAMVVAHLVDKLVLVLACKKEGISPSSYIPVVPYLLYSVALVLLVLLA